MLEADQPPAGQDVDDDVRPPRLKFSRYNVRVPLRSGRCLLFNSRTQQFSALSESEVGLLDRAEEAGDVLPTGLSNAMRATGFLVPEHVDELERAVSRFESKRHASQHLNLTIAATLKCNLACGYCFQGHNKPSTRMSDDVHEKLMALVEARAPGLKSLFVTWYGGEPLMNQQEIWRTATALRSLCTERGIDYSSGIITNGYLLNGKTAAKLVDHGCTDAQVTVDGTPAHHDRMRPHISGRGSFDVILRNIAETLESSQLRITLRISVDAENSEGVVELLHLLHEKGLARSRRLFAYFAPIEAITSGCAEYEAFSLSKIKYAQKEVELIRLAISFGLRMHNYFQEDGGVCQAVRPDDLIVTPTGELHKCWDTVSYGQFAVANIADPDANDRLREGLWSTWKPTNNPVCSACKILPLCGGGCAFKSLHPDETTGEAGSLPCISLKFNLAERLFEAAVAAGVVDRDEWDPEASPTLSNGVLKTGERHSFASMQAVAAHYATEKGAVAAAMPDA